MISRAKETKNLTEEEVKRLLSDSLTRYYGRRIEISDFEVGNLSPYPTKSACFKLSRLGLKEGEQGPIPAALVFKFYSPNMKSGLPIEEGYDFEKGVLEMAEDLKCDLNGRAIRVFPICYSNYNTECDDYWCFFREFIEEPSLEQLANEKSKELHWNDLKESVAPIALLHVKSDSIRRRLQGLEEITQSAGSFGFQFTNYICRVMSANKNGGDSEELEKIRLNFTDLAEKFLTDERLESVINGDLNLYPGHLTRNSMLDAGSICIGPFTADLAVYGSPMFDQDRDVGDLASRSTLALSEYTKMRDAISEELRYENHVLDNIPNDLKQGSFLMSVCYGGARKSSSTLKYRAKYVGKKRRKQPMFWVPEWLRTQYNVEPIEREGLEEGVRLHIQRAIFDSIDGFYEFPSLKSKYGEQLSKLKESLYKTGIGNFELSKEYSGEDPNQEKKKVVIKPNSAKYRIRNPNIDFPI